MKFLLLLTTLVAPLATQALEYTIQTDNEVVRIAKIVLAPGDEVGLHRDEYPRVVFGVKGGTFTRIEEDGSLTKVNFPTGEAIFLEADPVDQQHRGVNKSGKTIEIIVAEFKK
jgi:hypothetical protein